MEHIDTRQTLNREIAELISLKQEGGYWDFKKQWYDKKAKCDLLHDIICMANNLQNRDAYIIIGVDEEDDYEIVDIHADSNRRNTQNLVDFLKDKKFAGGVRPIVHVEQINMRYGELDVIVIENSHNTPFFLTEQYEGIRANYIYTRVMDSNTSIDRSADINHTEYLWRKRFYIDETPLERFRHYLSKSDGWDTTQDCDAGYFYKSAPEYTIISESDEGKIGYEYYMFGQVDLTPHWWLVTLKYYQTAIAQFQGIALDGGRSFVIAPKRAYDLYSIGISSIGYFIQNDLRSRLLEFFHQKETPEEMPFHKYMNTVLVFSSEDESNQFFEYVGKNYALYRELLTQQGDTGLPFFPELPGLIMDEYKKEYRDALVLQKMLSIFRNTNEEKEI